MYKSVVACSLRIIVIIIIQDLFQIYIRVSHQSGDVPDFDPPFTNPLIDDIFIEVTDLPAVLYEERVSLGTVPYEATGDFGRASLQLRVSALCARGYNGSDCNTFCQDVDGEVTCEQGQLIHLIIRIISLFNIHGIKGRQ